MSILGLLARLGFGVAENIIEDVAANQGKKVFKKSRQLKYWPFFLRKKKYFNELEESIKRMPFIYGNIGIDTSIEDFVDIEVRKVNNASIKLSSPKSFDKAEKTAINYERLRENLKLIIIGNAGIGKTTFLTHITYSIIKGKKIQKQFWKPKTIPIYIPLKAIANTKPSPIISYILENNPIFSLRKGVGALVSALENRLIFLMLDGYDEISFSNKENYIRDEISVLLGEKSYYSRNYDRKFSRIYDAFEKNKVWMTTREEFYRLNPLDIPEDDLNSRNNLNNTVTILKITGLGQNRVQYVKKVFDFYKEKGVIFKKFLDEELFIDNIDNTNDKELISLSGIPLFLNVMCYIYAKNVEKYEKVIVDWKTDVSELILECVKLLLEDLDAYKVRNLPDAQREAFKRRRNSYTAEKIEFLKYFSVSLLINGKSVFDKSFLDNEVKLFFSRNSGFVEGAKILQDYSNPSLNNPDFSKQLLYSGLFSAVDIQQEVVLFDVPHRRFKEVLAMKALEKKENLKYLLKNVLKPSLSEFLLLCYESDQNIRLNILDSAIELLDENNFEYINDVINNWFNKRYDSEINDFFLKRLKKAIRLGRGVRILSENLKFLEVTDKFYEDLFDNVIEEGYMNSLFCVCSIKRPGYLKLILNNSLPSGSSTNFRIHIVINKYVLFSLIGSTVNSQLFEKFAEKKLDLPSDEFKDEFVLQLLKASLCQQYYKFCTMIVLHEMANENMVQKLIFLAALDFFNNDLFKGFSKISEYFYSFRLYSEFNEESYTFTKFQNSDVMKNIKNDIVSLGKKIKIAKPEDEKVAVKLNSNNLKYQKFGKNEMEGLVVLYETIESSISQITEREFNELKNFIKTIREREFIYLQNFVY